MLIDLILDRKDGKTYNAKEFYNQSRQYGSIAYDVVDALDRGTERDVKKCLKMYIVRENYNDDIIQYIENVN